MAKFTFRLQKLLEYRQLQEKWAKDAYLEAVARKVEAEREIAAIETRKRDSLMARPCALDERLSLDTYVTRLEDESRAAQSAVEVLSFEVENALSEWNEAKQNAEAFAKLRDVEFDEYQLSETRREQSELDEWAVFRRAS